MYQSNNFQQQNIPYFSQSSMRQQAYQTPYLKGRLVSSLEEAKATSIDFDGSIFYFPDLANRKIYTKQINMDGTATLNVYEIQEIATMEVAPIDSSNFITRAEFEEAINKLRDDLKPVSAKITF